MLGATLTGKFVEKDIDSHREKFGVIVFDREEGEVFFLVEILQGEKDKQACSLDERGITIREMMVKQPPVADVSY